MLSLLINHEALKNEAWKVGMTEEVETIERNNTWKLRVYKSNKLYY